MRIAIVGYGKMGRIVEEAALSSSNEVVAVIDPLSDSPNVTGRSLSDLDVEGVDVVIDFSSAEGAYENMLFYAGSSLSAVVGTTGWYDRLEELKNNLVGQNCSIIYSGNFSIGVAIMLRASAYISSLMNRAASYDVAIEEIHHRAKSDCPSGTAKMIASTVLDNMDRKKSIVYGNPEKRIDSSALQVSSLRLGCVNGIHSLIFDSEADTIELKHTARSRIGFAEGALSAAAWIHGRKGFFSFDDFINDFIGV